MMLDVGFLSRQRPDSIRTAVTECLATTAVPCAVTVVFDDDLEHAQQFGAEFAGADVAVCNVTPRHYYVRAANALYEAMQRRAADEQRSLDYIALFNDDTRFRRDWAHEGIAALHAQFPDGMGLVEYDTYECCGTYITRAELIDTVCDGYVAEPCYTMYCSDTDLLVRLRQQHLYGFLPGKFVTHEVARDDVRAETASWEASDLRALQHRARQCGWGPAELGWRAPQ